MSSLKDKAFWDDCNAGFLPATVECDFLHPQDRNTNSSSELSETHYFGFSVPEHKIHSANYMWHHPNLGAVTGGAWVWRGQKSDALRSELFNWTAFADDEMLSNDLWDYKFDNGYHVETLEPLKRHRLRYCDPARGNEFDIETEALMEPMLLQSGLHFEQAVRARGTLTLRGEVFEVDCTNVRDRSWGQVRREVHAPTPPIDWMTGVFGDDLMFGATAFDHPDLSPDWASFLAIPGGDPSRGGWVRRDGDLSAIVDIRKRVVRNPVTLSPESVEMQLTDAANRTYAISGEIIAANWIRLWPNQSTWTCLTRWDYEGRMAYGDLQEVQWHDFIHGATQPRA